MKRVGLVILVLVVVAVVAYQLLQRPGAGGGAPNGLSFAPAGPVTTVKGAVGSEKDGLMKDPEVRKILRERHHLEVDVSRVGSIEMVRQDPAGKDFLWPASQLALEIYREKGGKVRKSEVLFNSPVVLYSRGPVTDALVKQKLVTSVNGTYYVDDLPGLVKLVDTGATWKSLGLPQLYGKVSIFSTDPNRSSSGMLFAGLLANVQNHGEVVEDAAVKDVLPSVKRFFGRQGYMQSSSGELFNQVLQQGIGSFPIVAGYEAQLVEFSLENPKYRDLLRKEITTLYPRPTVWSSHPLIALTENGEKLLAAMQDPDLQRLAWERHGFRSGLIGVQNDPKVLQVTGVPAAIENVMPTPQPRVMEKLLAAVAPN